MKGYVRFFRKIIKQKDKLRKDIIQNRFKEWLEKSLKGSIIKRTIMIRISVSRDKDANTQYNNNRFKMDKSKETEKSNSVNKKIVKSISKSKNKGGKTNDINKEKNKANNINNLNINNISTIKNYNTEVNKLIEQSHDMPKVTSNIGNNTSFVEIKATKKKNNNKINNINYSKYDPKNLRNIQNTTNPNMNITYTSSTYNSIKGNPLNYNSNSNNYLKNKEILSDKNISKGYYMKFEGYHDNKNTLGRQNNEYNKNAIYNPYELKKRTYERYPKLHNWGKQLKTSNSYKK